MGKGKPRHDPNKRANQRGSFCSHCETSGGINGDVMYCIYDGTRAINICKGNPHNCMKVSLRKAAALKEVQRDNGVVPKGVSINSKGNLTNPM